MADAGICNLCAQVDAVLQTMNTGLHVSMEVAQDILARMSDFFSGTENELELEVEDVDMIVEVGHGATTTIKILEQMNKGSFSFHHIDQAS